MRKSSKTGMRYCLAVLMIMAALMVFQPGTVMAAETGTTYVANVDILRVRSGAGPGYTQIGAYSRGKVLTVLEIVDGWGRIDYAGQRGWIVIADCTKSSASASTASKASATEVSVSAVGICQITGGSVNVRTGPGASYQSLGHLSKGSKVDVLEIYSTWGRINYNGSRGWICMDYCKKTGSGSSSTGSSSTGTSSSTGSSSTGSSAAGSSSASGSSGTKYTVTARALNVRSGAGVSYSTLGTLSKNKVVDVLETSNGWGRISYNGKNGWIALNYCTKGSTAASGSSSSGSTKSTGSGGSTQASVFSGLTEAQAVAIIGPLCTTESKRTGIPASVLAAQFILESGYGKTGLAQSANNVFGMKKDLSNNTWSGSYWDGTSIVTRDTQEEVNGKMITIKADFRKYSCIESSIKDHSAYLIAAKKGSSKRYPGINTTTSYSKAIQILVNGGYATDSNYGSKLTNIISKWNLTQYDVK